MAQRPPAASLTAAPGIKHLIVDSSPLLTSPLASLRGMAMSFLVTPDVVSELRDKKGREVMREAELYLGVPGEGGVEGAKGGFSIREPTLEAVAKSTSDLLPHESSSHMDQSPHSLVKREILPFSLLRTFVFSLSVSRWSLRRMGAGEFVIRRDRC